MKFLNPTKPALVVTFAVGALLLTACQGQNPFKRESNPVRAYPKVSESIRTKTGLVPFNQNQEPPKPPPDNSQAICSSPFAVMVDDKAKETDVLDFPEDKLTSYTIDITNRLGDEFTIESAGFPERESLRLLRKVSANRAVYQISWNPKRLNSGQFTKRFTGELTLKSAALTKYCRGIGRVLFTLLSEKSGRQPLLSVAGLPQTAVTYGQQRAFSIIVEDPSGIQPELNKFTYAPAASSGEVSVIDGVKAISCLETAEQVPSSSKWKFSCLFDSNLLADNSEAVKLLNSNKTAKVVVFATAKSRDNGTTSSSHQITIRVKFEKVIQAGPTATTSGAKP